ncbi:TolC family protein [Proteiniphilum sp. X52]|nr:TolC family protein [Proteiniphilum sp. X52]
MIWMLSTVAVGQIVTLDEIQQKAEANYPAIARYGIIEKIKNYNIVNANKAYLPQGSITMQATWQSDVPHIDLDFPEGMPSIEIPVPDQDQYRVIAELNQLIWDGGNISAGKKSRQAHAELEKRELETEIYALRERVNNLYFGILLMKENLQQQAILENELQRNYRNVLAYMQNGLANEADLSAVKVEQLKAGQKRIQLESMLEAYIRMLSTLAGESLDQSMVFVKPSPDDGLISPVINRPELKVFNAQQAAVEIQKSLLKARNMPKLGAFAQAGYGKPGLNMFDNDFSAYFLGGIRLSWNFGNLYTLGNDRKKIDLQKQSVDIQRETFLHNLSVRIPQQQAEIERYKKTMQDDDEIIRHQTLIREAAEVKVENGTLTVSDLMKEINAEEAAKQAKTLHEIQYLMAVYALKHTTNQP